MAGGILYHKGEEVPEAGAYVCVPCGYKMDLGQGVNFPECAACLAGSEDGPEEYASGAEIWEKVVEGTEEEEEE